MKFSEAIRLGAMTCPQAFGQIENYKGERCAIGCALAAVGESEQAYADLLKTLLRHWPWLGDRINFLPRPTSVWYVITLLNDEQRWTRERIADWVAGLEAEQEAVAAAEAQAVAVA